MPIIALNSPPPVFVTSLSALRWNSLKRIQPLILVAALSLVVTGLSMLPAACNGQTDYVTRFNDSLEPDIGDLFSSILGDEQQLTVGFYLSDDGNVNVHMSDESFEAENNKVANINPESTTKRDSAKQISPKLTPDDLIRKQQIARCLSIFYQMPVNTEDWRPWTIMHGLLPFGQQSQVIHKDKHYSAVDYLCHNAIGNDTYMLYVAGESLGVQVGPGVQGHEGQFLAMLAQANVPRDQPIHVQGKRFTIDDLIKYEKLGCRQNTELTFKLIGLSHYLDSDEIWQNSIGQSWNIERLLFEELKQPINGAACGGTHRLMGLSYAVNKRIEKGKQADGQWARAENFVRQYQDFAMRYQNQDGSFSTNWFVTQESDIDIKKRLYTTGHFVEWLAVSLPREKLSDPRFKLSIDYLTKLMVSAPALDLEIGPKGHAIHALRIYQSRVYGANSNPEQISPADMARVRKALIKQSKMKPEFDSALSSTPAQPVSYPNKGFSNGGRRVFRRR